MAAVRANDAALAGFCGSEVASALAASPIEALGYAFAAYSPSALLLDWLVMLAAMMPVLLAHPILHVWRSVVPRRRPGAVTLFALGYLWIWSLAAIPLATAALWLQLATGGGVAVVAAAVTVALVWSASPWQARAIDRGHRLGRITSLGWRADRDAAVFGVEHGAWCVCACWPWMLVPMTAGNWHVPAMAVAASAILTKRLTRRGSPRWRLPAPLDRLLSSPRFVRISEAARHG
ncbi:DUF2182 domain-containing protein [Bosea sp. ASV33]|uniref:copper chaperone n=1 Tax=Bosea sp. ASV33 TaxID=2795106 RepID=UPI0018EAE2C1|nr:DUF2182 domain-containing protein [Bosea sp. ASV33]